MNILLDEINNFTPKRGKGSFDKRHKNEFIDTSGYVGTKESLNKLNESKKVWNLLIVFCFLLITLIIFLLRAFNLQILKKGTYSTIAENNRIRRSLIEAERGVIYDRNDEVLVRNKPAFSIELNTLYCMNGFNNDTLCIEIAKRIAEQVEVDLDLALNDISQRKKVVILASGLTKDQVLPIESNLNKYPGLVISVRPKRDYVYDEAFAHVLGYIGLDNESLEPLYVGKYGIEKSYNNYLTGVSGSRIIQIDSTGSIFNLVAEEDSLPGKNIHTSLDKDLQLKAYELLKEKIANKEATAGAVVAQDPKTGKILTLVSYPSFSSNKMSGGIKQTEYNELITRTDFPFFDRAISATYPPGSTFKMVMASAALEEGVVTKNTTIFDPGYISVGGSTFKNWNTSGHGDVNLKRALQVSNDTYFYTIGGGYGNIKGLGIEKIAEWAKRFGFGSITGVDIDGEESGYIPDGKSRQWYLGDTYITSIGQGDVLATPLQVDNYVTYFANGGKIFEPRIVEAIDGVGDISSKELISGLINQDHYIQIREGMKAVTQSGGTAYPLFDFHIRHKGIELGGKTGTSEYTKPDGEEATHALFTVFGPYDDPNIVLTVFLEGGGGGSDDAAPIAKELLDLWFK